MGKKNQPGARKKSSMAKTNKSLNTTKSDGHLHKRKQLRRDSAAQINFINRIRADKGLPPLEVKKPVDDRTSSEFEEGDRLGIEDGEQILEQRLYVRGKDGEWLGELASEEDCVAAHSRVRRERAFFRDLDGSKVESGRVIRDRKGVGTERRKDKKRRASGVLRSIMVRLMPHEGELVTELDTPVLARAMDRTVNQFAEALGCDVVSAVAHRMHSWDCHLHIQYTMVIPMEESPSLLGRRLKPWKAMAADAAREALMAERVEPSPRAINKKKKELIRDGKLAPAPLPEIVFRKVVGKRSLRDDAIMGHSFRAKMNLVRLAEEAKDLELAGRVIRRGDGKARFAPLAAQSDEELEGRYLDLWLERQWRRNVRAVLPGSVAERLRADGLTSVRDYVDYGTVLVEQTHLDTRKEKLDAERAELDKLAAKVRQDAAAAKREAEDEARRMVEEARARADELGAEAREAIAEKEAAEAAVRKKEQELQRVREAAAQAAKVASSDIEDLKDSNKRLGDLVARFVDLFARILAVPRIREFLKELWPAIEKLCSDVGLDLGKTKQPKSPEPGDPGKPPGTADQPEID